MPYEIFKGIAEEIEDHLNGTLVLGPYPKSGLPVGGRTLIFVQPAAVVVTFGGALGSIRTIPQIVADIAAAIAAANPRMRTYRSATPAMTPDVVADILLALQNDANGIEIGAAGTSNPYFRLSTTANTVTLPITASDVLGFTQGTTEGHYVVVIGP